LPENIENENRTKKKQQKQTEKEIEKEKKNGQTNQENLKHMSNGPAQHSSPVCGARVTSRNKR
jgi:hypothetical protein